MRRSAFLLLLVLPIPALAQEAIHPLDELSAAEHWALYETLRATTASGRTPSSSMSG